MVDILVEEIPSVKASQIHPVGTLVQLSEVVKPWMHLCASLR
jgi:hypothetical protein